MNIEESIFCCFHFDDSLNRIYKKIDSFDIKASENLKYELLLEELFWIHKFLISIHTHLSNRESQGRKIIDQDVIKIQMADISNQIQVLESIRMELRPISWCLVSDWIRNICLALARLLGARAFLSGSVLEMLCVFENLNQRYWVSE